MVCGAIGLTDEQTVKYAEQLIAALLTLEACGDPVLFGYQIDLAREVAVWKTSDGFRRFGGGA